jgi:hypothetical protein
LSIASVDMAMPDYTHSAGLVRLAQISPRCVAFFDAIDPRFQSSDRLGRRRGNAHGEFADRANQRALAALAQQTEQQAEQAAQPETQSQPHCYVCGSFQVGPPPKSQGIAPARWQFQQHGGRKRRCCSSCGIKLSKSCKKGMPEPARAEHALQICRNGCADCDGR